MGSVITQGSVIGPLLFIIYIIDMDSEVKKQLSKCAGDTKLGCKVDSREGVEVDEIQERLDTLMH